MDERLIREKTAAIFDAYRELTGSQAAPGIEEFLMLRVEAIKEEGAELKQTSASGPHGRLRRETSVQDCALQKNKDAEKKGIAIVPEPQSEEDLFEGSLTEKDAFSILRGIQDPWNRNT